MIKGRVDFPAWEIPGIRKELDERGFFFSIRVSNEVGKYKRGQIWDSPVGPLFVVITFHYDRLEEVPYYPEMVKALIAHKQQLDELKRLAKKGGVDVIIWSRPREGVAGFLNEPTSATVSPLFKKVDAYTFAVPDLRQALLFYEKKLGHKVIWKMKDIVGLRMPETDAEIVLTTRFKNSEVDFLVDDAQAAANRFVAAGGKVVLGPVDTPVGKAFVLRDPWGNRLTVLDMSKGPISTSSVSGFMSAPAKEIVQIERVSLLKKAFGPDYQLRPEINETIWKAGADNAWRGRAWVHKGGHWFTLYHKGKPVAMACLGIGQWEGSISTAVHPKHLGKGHASVLVTRVARMALERYGRYSAQVLTTNVPSLRSLMAGTAAMKVLYGDRLQAEISYGYEEPGGPFPPGPKITLKVWLS